MRTQLALAYIVEFHEHPRSPVNKVLVKNLDRFGAVGEKQSGFVTHITEEFGTSHLWTNISVWADHRSLQDYVDKSEEYKALIDRVNIHMFLWWIEEGHVPTIGEARVRYGFFKNGPNPSAFCIEEPFPERVTGPF